MRKIAIIAATLLLLLGATLADEPAEPDSGDGEKERSGSFLSTIIDAASRAARQSEELDLDRIIEDSSEKKEESGDGEDVPAYREKSAPAAESRSYQMKSAPASSKGRSYDTFIDENDNNIDDRLESEEKRTTTKSGRKK